MSGYNFYQAYTTSSCGQPDGSPQQSQFYYNSQQDMQPPTQVYNPPAAQGTSTTTTTITSASYGTSYEQPIAYTQQAISNIQQPTSYYQQHLYQSPPTMQQSSLSYDHLYQAPPAPSPHWPNSSNSETTTTTQNVQVTGGSERQAAAAKGTEEFTRFDDQVSAMLMQLDEPCPARYRYYRVEDSQMGGGYLCGGGYHFVADQEVDRVLSGRTRHPQIWDANFKDYNAVKPPNTAFDKPMHKAYERCMTKTANKLREQRVSEQRRREYWRSEQRHSERRRERRSPSPGRHSRRRSRDVHGRH